MHFTDKIGIITGAGTGLGAALAREYSRHGARLVLADIRFENVSAIASNIDAEAIQLNVADSRQVETVINDSAKKYGRLDFIINNAGVMAHGDISSFNCTDWDHILAVNLRGVVSGSMAAYRIMQQQGFGQIINIASLAGLVNAPLFAPYAASKAAVVSFTRSLAAEAKTSGVQISLVCPGNIDTGILPVKTLPIHSRCSRHGCGAPHRSLDCLWQEHDHFSAVRTLDMVGRAVQPVSAFSIQSGNPPARASSRIVRAAYFGPFRLKRAIDRCCFDIVRGRP